jgi:2-oxoglutarate ferredoxin oxidoreductase subunit alpha
VREAQAAGLAVSHAHLRYLNPFPRNLGDLLGRFQKVLIPELNLGQLRTMIRSEFLLDASGLNKVKGKPFAVSEVLARIREELAR